MIDFEQMQLLIYQHAVQLTLIDHPIEDAFALAHEVAALAFDEEYTRRGLARHAREHGDGGAARPASEADGREATEVGDTS